MKNVSVKKMNGKGKNALRAVLIVVVLIFATCFALAACAKGEEVQIEKVTSASEINRLIAKANFSAENAVRDKMEERYGVLSDYSYINGKATANVEKDGKSYAVSAEIDLGVSDFEVTKYTNAELSGNNLTYTSEGQDVSENVSDKIVVEENGVIYVIDPSEALNTISIAVSDAILTENVDPENPTDPENPDPENPENPTDPENPDPENPENPTDPEEPENPDPDEPENPGGEDKPDPEEPENPDSQIETIDDINVIEQLLSQKDLTIEALAKAAATAFYGQGNVSNLSYQNGIVSGQAKTAEGTVNFSANLDLSATDFEGKFYAGAELSADGKTLTFYQNGTLATLTITEDMAVIETADGVNILDTAAAEEMVANKFETTNNETSVPSQDITFDSWQELMSAGNGVVQDAVFDILQTNLLTESVIKSMFGNSMTLENLNDGTIEILKWAFGTNDSNEITAIEVMGVRNGAQTNNPDSKQLQTASFDLQTPIALDSIGAGASNNDYTISYPDGKGEVTIDLSAIATGTTNVTFNRIFRYTVGSQTLSDTNQAYFDLCMPLAVEAGVIDANATLGFVSVQGRSSTNANWGTTYNITITAINLNTNKYVTIMFVFDDEQDKDTLLERVQSAIERGNFSATAGTENTIISGDQIFETEDWENVVIYIISFENQK